ncbi:hypothetical protein [Allocoleopsis sp.]|uniref:hypothetical protein n=1 Tax=Allocoleopsis sp. TaxID=3088169 RepID=UPI002FD426F8
MELFKQIILFLTLVAPGLQAIRSYLTVSKLWKQKHEKVVAESISTIAFLGMLGLTCALLLDFIIAQNWAGSLTLSLDILSKGFCVLVAMGLWVPSKRRAGIWTLLGRALRSERNEVGDLAKSLFHPASSEKVLNILVKIALLDEQVDAREKQFIQAFADEWNINFSWEEATRSRENDRHSSYTKLRQSMVEYLETSPPANQVSELGDIIINLVKIDDDVSQEEELMVAELQGLIANYLGKTSEGNLYKVAVVPRNSQQEQSISSLLPQLIREKIAGGVAYVDGPFFSRQYAEIVCNQYRQFNFLTLAVPSNNR